jgi:hypothetical protein
VFLFWLCCRCNGYFAGAIVIEAHSLIHARQKATIAGLEMGSVCEIRRLQPSARRQIPKGMIGRLLGLDELLVLRRSAIAESSCVQQKMLPSKH